MVVLPETFGRPMPDTEFHRSKKQSTPVGEIPNGKTPTESTV